jgi:hypothetical protein
MVQQRTVSRWAVGARAVPVLLLGAAVAACGGLPNTSQRTGARSTADAPATTQDGSLGAPSSSTTTGTGTAMPSPSGSATAAPHAAVATSPGGAVPALGVNRPAASRTAQAPTGGKPVPQPGTWEIEVYYTPVESFHHGAPQAIKGCGPNAPDSCSKGTTPLGTYPSDFLQAVQDNDDGLITSGQFSGKYLSWDDDDGWSIENADLQDNDQPMQPWVTAGAPDAIPSGTRFQVLSCGVDINSGNPPSQSVCAQLMNAHWVVGDSTGDPAGTRDIELYVGKENAPNFENSPLVIDDINARTTLP